MKADIVIITLQLRNWVGSSTMGESFTCKVDSLDCVEDRTYRYPHSSYEGGAKDNTVSDERFK